ncbi:MAG: FmdE family protein [Desulfobulbaceae bacterium]|nr:FmdE family protein [Desulfobulbaceae bacterium]
MKRLTINIFISFVVLFFVSGYALADPAIVSNAIVGAMKSLGIKPGAKDICVLTNANYVRLQGNTTESYVDVIANKTGCSIGKKNFLFVNLRVQEDLVICLLNATTDQLYVIRYDGDKLRSEQIVMSEKKMRERGYLRVLGQGVLGADGFSVATILGAWEIGAPYDLLKAGELHGHICPGTIMGYLTSKAILDQYPLDAGEGYYLIGSPNECKEDVYQVILGITPGSGKLAIKHLSEGQVEENEKFKLMGILLRWSSEMDRRIGVVLGINRDALLTVTKLDKKMERGLKLAAIFDLMGYLDNYNDFFIPLKEFSVTPGLRRKLMMAGVNPYEELGMSGSGHVE